MKGKRTKRDVVVRLLVTPAERQSYFVASLRSGLTLSAWIRQRLRGDITVSAPPFMKPPMVKLTKAQRKREREHERIGIEETLAIERETTEAK